MTITYHPELLQGSDEWFAIRCGLLTASEMDRIITPNFALANNDRERLHVYELAAQRISKYVEPTYVSDDMLRGMADEIHALALYNQKYAETNSCGFITNDEWGFTIGYSPDDLVGEKGLVECKSRRQGLQIKTIALNTIPVENVIQVQTGLLVSGREWCDFVSYSGGLPMAVIRIEPYPELQEAIVTAAAAFEKQVANTIHMFRANVEKSGYFPTERIEQGDELE